MTEKVKKHLWSWKPILAFKQTGKKALALLLSAALVITTMPVIQMPVSAEETADAAVQDSGYIAGKDGFHVVAYDESARIEIPFVSGAKNYKVYLSQTEGLTDFSGASCVLNSDTYQSYTYAVNGNKDAANDSKTISIGYSDSEDNTYDFYLVTNDGSADTVQDSAEVKTRSTADATWTTPGHYDTGWYGDGSASEFTIKTAAQLAGLAVLTDGLNGETTTDFTGKTIHLASSVDLSAYLWTPIGTSDNHFCGSFDGGNYDGGKYTVQNVVTGLHTNDSKPSYQGLFGDVGNGFIIQNVGVVSGNINGCKYVGGVVGYASNGTLSNSYQTGTVSSSGSYSYSGGVIGYAADDTVTNCYNTGSVRGDSVGGIAGFFGGSTVTNCYNTGAVSSTGERIGGVVSDATNSTMTNCYNTGAVSGSGRYVGGIVSAISSGSSLTNCYNTGAVSGSSKYVGGIVSMINFGSSLTNCYNTGAVSGTGDNVGGVAGSASGQTTNCYNIGAVSGKGDNVGGVAGSASGQTTNCYNTGAVSGTGDNVGGVAGSSSRTIKNAYSIGQVNGVLGGQYYNSTGTLDSSVSSKDDLINKVISDDGSDFIASPTNYAQYPLYDHKENGLFKDTNPVNQGYPVLRSFGYTDSTDAKGFSPATITVEDGKITVDSDYGDGTESKPYIIRNAYQMDLVRSYTQTKDVYFKLAGNVDISPAQYNKTPDENGSWTSSDSWKAIGDQFDHFKGNLDGNHCTISGMFLSSGGVLDDAEGLFAYTVWGTIQDLGTAASNMTANGKRFTYLGSIAGFGSGTIRNCYNAGTVSSYGSTSTCELGGIVGRANYYDSSESAFISTTFENCYNSGTVIGNGNNAIIGGVVGCSDNHISGVEYQSTLSCCYNSGAVTGSSPENSGTTGGVAGLWYGSFTDSFNVGKVSSTSSTSSPCCTGGVAGKVIAASDTNNIQKNCYNLGTVSNDGTDNWSGGVFGNCGGSLYTTTGLVSNCYNAGTVYTDGAAGGVAGGIYHADVQNCYNIGKVNGISDVGGIGGGVGNATLQSCYNTGVIDARSQTKGIGIGGIAGYLSGKITNCYNTAVIHSSSDKVGGIAGQVGNSAETDPSVISTCYNTGNLDIGSGSDMHDVGGIVGDLGDNSVSLCYNLGNVHSRGGIMGNTVYGASVSKCYYTNTSGGGGFDDSGTTAFISYKSQMDKGSTADMKEVAFADLDPDFKAAFGITDVQYPDGYESSDTDVLTVKDKTVTAVEVGDAEVRGTAGEHSNAKIIISQNALNMTDASGFKDAGTEKVSNVVGLPVSVVVLPKFTAFSVKAGDGKNYTGKIDNSKNTVWVKVPDGTDISSLVATFTVNADAGDVSVYADGKEQKSGSTQIDFSEDKTYSISGKSGYRDYTVVVAPESKSLAGIDDYSIEIGDSDYAGTIDEDKKTISVTVPYGTDLTKLVADFSASNGSDVTVGEAAQESGTTENDFSSPVSYKVTGLDKSTETYTVKVTCADKSEKSLTHFELSDGDDTYQGKIDQKDHTITVIVSEDSNVSSLIAAFDTLAPNVKVGDKEQTSGTTANDFTNTVTYTVTAADDSTQDYKVTVTVEGESSCGFQSFSLTDKDDNTYTGTIDKEKHTIAVTVPSGTDVTELIAKFEATADATVTVEKSKQESGTTKNDFTDSVTYTVKAADGTTQDYKVTVKVASGAEFQSYSLKEKDGSDYYTGTIDK
ncbi:GLUG motif-containing protein, partial [Caproicibacter sp.]|uniref:GLUG motif-containing protein n=1 Tax=Caproicibacter sp. TaxID=2814884 RepID=UPI003988E5D6